MLNNRILLAEIVNLVSLITESSCKVIFNCDSFDFDVAPSALELHRPSLPDDTASTVKKSAKEDAVSVQTSTDSASISNKSVEVDVSPGPNEDELVTPRNVTPDPLDNVVTQQTEKKSPDNVSVVRSPDVENVELSNDQVANTENEVDVKDTSSGETKPRLDSTETAEPPSPQVIDIRRSPESFLSSPEKCPIADEETVEIAKDDDIVPEILEKSISVRGSHIGTATVINSVPLLDGVISEHLQNIDEEKLFSETPSDSRLIDSEPSTSNLATSSSSPTKVPVDSHLDSPLYSEEADDESDGRSGEGDVVDPGSSVFPDNLTASSPIKTNSGTVAAPSSQSGMFYCSFSFSIGT